MGLLDLEWFFASKTIGSDVCFVFSAIQPRWCWSCCSWVFWFMVLVFDFWFNDYSKSCWALQVSWLVLLTRVGHALICDFRQWARKSRKFVVGDSFLCATATSRLCLVSRIVEFCRFQRYGDASMFFEYLSHSLCLTSYCFWILVIHMIDIGLIRLERVGVACCLAERSCWFLDYSVLNFGSYTS